MEVLGKRLLIGLCFASLTCLGSSVLVSMVILLCNEKSIAGTNFLGILSQKPLSCIKSPTAKTNFLGILSQAPLSYIKSPTVNNPLWK